MSISHPLKNINYRNQEMSSFWFKFKNGNQDIMLSIKANLIN
jgi:hypothetical protein